MGLCASSPGSAASPSEARAAASAPSSSSAAAGSSGSSAASAAGGASGSEERKVQEVLKGKTLALSRQRRINVTAEGVSQDELDRYEMRSVAKPAAAREAIQSALTAHFLFTSMDPQELVEVVNAMEPKQAAPAEVIIRQGDEGDRFYVAETGEFEVLVGGKSVASIRAPCSFGELALMYNCPRAATIRATREAKLWALPRLAFKFILARSTTKQVAETIRILRKMSMMGNLSEAQLNRVAEAMQKIKFSAGSAIIKQGDPGDVFYVIASGSCRCTKNGDPFLLMLKEGDFFGEQALLNSAPRAANVFAESDVAVLALDRQSFTELLGPLQEFLSAAHASRLEVERKQRADRSQQVASAAAASRAAGGSSAAAASASSTTAAAAGGGAPPTPSGGMRRDIQIKDLRVVSILGEGAFGLVKLVQHRSTGEVFALKTMQKARIVATNQQRNVVNEKRIMMECQHPYVLRLHTTLRDRDCVYMVLDFLQGGDMFGHLVRNDGMFNVGTAKYFAAIVTLVFEYLHDKDVVYRDLKPENLVLDGRGFLKVVDFGFAKKVTTRTFTLCGTPEYLAPEIVQGKGHNKGVDYWALGILIFEMLCGFSPFADQERNDQLTIYKNILRGNLVFPAHCKDMKARELIKRLLHPNPAQRLGCLKDGAADIKMQRWFSDMNWDDLLMQRIEPPIKPRVTSPLDTSNFDDWGPDRSKVEPYVPDGTNWDEEF